MRLNQDKLAAMRAEYERAGLDERDAADDPIAQFQRWFTEAVQAGVPEPNAMTLATASPDGTPSARLILLKGAGPEGFVFFTNYASRKGRDIEANPRAALVFYWHELARQVRIEGHVERTTVEDSTVYFHTRPRDSQIAAWASYQSVALEGRAPLDEKFAALQKRFDGREVPLPEFWGGYRVVPLAIEFWQGRPNRLHDRLLYTRADKRSAIWRRERLAP